jgi:hypothetical protein
MAAILKLRLSYLYLRGSKSCVSIGYFEAMNLEGGHSVDLADQGQILLPPGRNLTNVLVIYDRDYPPPDQLKQSWERFQNRRAFLIKLDITII